MTVEQLLEILAMAPANAPVLIVPCPPGSRVDLMNDDLRGTAYDASLYLKHALTPDEGSRISGVYVALSPVIA